MDATLDVSGVIVVAFEPQEEPAADNAERATTEEREALFARVAQLAASCSGQIVRRTLADRALHDTRADRARLA